MRFQDFPINIQRDLRRTAASQMPSGYVPSYYEQIAQNWLWLYDLGMKDGVRLARETSKLSS